MASVELIGYERQYVVPTGNVVYVKHYWADDWTWIPFLVCDYAMESLAPGVGEAEMHFDFGNMRYAELAYWDIYDSLFINGAYVKVEGYNYYGSETMWVGYVDVETVNPTGAINYPEGRQTFKAYGLEHILDRNEIYDSYTEDGFIDRVITFNELRRTGNTLTANKATGAYTFGSDENWTALDVVNYLLENFINLHGLTFELTGQTEILDQIVDTWDIEGLTPWKVLNEIINRKRGVGYKIATTGEGTIYIYVHSQLAYPMTIDDVYMPENPTQEIRQFAGLNNVDVEYHFSRTAYYDIVVGKGGPLVSTFTLSYGDGTLVKGWTDDEEDDYRAGNTTTDETDLHDQERQTDKFDHVFTVHKVPDDWDWTSAGGIGSDALALVSPTVLNDGTLDTATASNNHRPGKRFERELPFTTTADTGGEPTRRKPFALVFTSDREDNAVYLYAEKLDAIGKTPCHFDVSDSGLAVIVKPTGANHIAALNHWTGSTPEPASSGHEPEWDYEDLVVTVSMVLDEYLIVQQVVPGVADANFDFPRLKVINDKDATIWWVAANTCEEVTENQFVEYTGDNPIRDDSARLRAKVQLATSYYGIPRSTMTYHIGMISLFDPVGSMIAATVGPEGYTYIGTVTTQRRWVFDPENQYTEIVTGFEELQFEKLGGKAAA